MAGSALSDEIRGLEEKFRKLIQKNQELARKNVELENRLNSLEAVQGKKPGNDKLDHKIDAIVREIDDCLAELKKTQQ